MFILIYFLSIGIATYVVNRSMALDDNNPDAYQFSKEHARVIAGLFVLACILQLFTTIGFLKSLVFAIAAAVYIIGTVVTLIAVSGIRQKNIVQKREDIFQIYEILKPVTKAKNEIDYNDLPFEVKYEKGKVSEIVLGMDPTTFKEPVIMSCTPQLNQFFSYYVWKVIIDQKRRQISYLGTPLPPHIAVYPGSWLRNSQLVPLGLGGLGELCATLEETSESKAGRSLYQYEDGRVPGLFATPSTPQILVAGGTGGGKSIWVGQEIYD